MSRGSQKHRRGGWLTADCIVAMAILAAAGNVLAVAWNRQQVAQGRLADTRAATRLAEEVLIDLQTHQSPPAKSADDNGWSLSTASGATTGPWVWVDVDAHVGKSHCALAGLAPRDIAAQNGGAP